MVVVALILGVVMGYIIALIVHSDEVAGTVHVIDEDGTPYLFLELNDEVEHISGKKHVKFEVHEKSLVSQK